MLSYRDRDVLELADHWWPLMVWIIGACCMMFFGACLVAIGLSVGMLGYAIIGGVLVLAGIFLLVSMRRSRGNRPPVLR
jgi:hypothetical protein